MGVQIEALKSGSWAAKRMLRGQQDSGLELHTGLGQVLPDFVEGMSVRYGVCRVQVFSDVISSL